MFGIIADLLSSIITILFPVFASYKALRTSDPAQLTPWLMYWVVLSCILLAESWAVFILGWLPFYSWIRLGLLSYLVLPQTQGAKVIYQDYVDPFLAQHEHDIDIFIGNAHERGKAIGLQYLKQAIELFRQKVFGFPPRVEPPPPPTSQGSYAQSLLSRFNLPSARQGLVAPAGDFYGLLSSAVAAATSSGKSREVQAEELSASGTLFPREMASNAEKMSYIASQRERLGVLMSALDKEHTNLAPPADRHVEADIDRRMRDVEGMQQHGEDGLRKNRSDHSFEAIEHEDVGTERQGKRTTSGGWVPQGWVGSGSPSQQRGPSGQTDTGTSSGVEPQWR